MSKHNKGVFVVIEGNDGAGKTTQVEMLLEWMKGLDPDTKQIHEPSDNPIGRFIRKNYLSGLLKIDDPLIASDLWLADRQLHSQEIREYLSHGVNLVCDRYYLSTLVYQTLNITQQMQKQFMRLIMDKHRDVSIVSPMLFVYIDTPPDVCIHRIQSRSGTPEIFDDSKKIYLIDKGYKMAIDLLRNEYNIDIAIVDGHHPASAVHEAIVTQIYSRLMHIHE